ncbi:hypothetical protein [Segatella oris]|uniref:McrC family protein n=1 Tax=Segatella oris TaxID=28135 RepID=UPI0028E85A72|nr:hypothetical protein [Segatella oris]
MTIELTDNTIESETNRFQRNEIASLFPFADKTIADLCREHEGLLVFPESMHESKDKIEAETFLSIQNTSNPDEVRLVTGNIMGFVGVGGLTVKIKSRFETGGKDYFLHYMLQKVLSLNIFNLDVNSDEEEVLDLMMLMFPHLLKSALQQGVFREYRSLRHNDSNVRGVIDVGRHLRTNIPFAGRIAYSTRDYSCDNDVTQLIRHTIEFMRTSRFGRIVLKCNREIIAYVKAIEEHTALYNKGERSAVIHRNLRLKTHPYYTEYRPLQLLCLQILRMEEVKYGEDDNEIHGLLFDGAWLWEEYINTLLEEFDFIHAENKLHKKGIWLFEDIDEEGKMDRSGRRYPDFYKDNIVLDAKYKRLENYEKVAEVNRDDIHQVITYMNALHATKGGFVAPLTSKPEKSPVSRLRDSLSTLGIYGVEISKEVSSYAAFVAKMQENEQDFITSINELEIGI